MMHYYIIQWGVQNTTETGINSALIVPFLNMKAANQG